MLCLHICTNMILPFSCLLNLKLESIHCHFYIKVGPIKDSKKKKDWKWSIGSLCVHFCPSLPFGKQASTHLCCFYMTRPGFFSIGSFCKYMLKMHLCFLKLENKISSLMNIRSSLEWIYKFPHFKWFADFSRSSFIRLPKNCNLCYYAEFLALYFL